MLSSLRRSHNIHSINRHLQWTKVISCGVVDNIDRRVLAVNISSSLVLVFWSKWKPDIRQLLCGYRDARELSAARQEVSNAPHTEGWLGMKK